MKNVMDFGAKGDGVTKDTQAVQRAIDAGGMVYLPAGTYLCGTLYLKSNGGLELAPGAKILGSPDPEDYNADDFCPQNRAHWDSDWARGGHLIVALEQKNVIIRGGGTIDGNRSAFFPLPEELHRIWYTPIRWRPGQMLFFCECEGVTVTDVHMENAPYWTCFFHGCTDVMVRNVRINNHRWVRNSDGIDIDCCCRVTISDCIILTGDDSITLRGVDHLLKHPRPCEHVSVTNCIFSSLCDAIRVGVGGGMIRDAVFSNITITHSSKGIVVCSSYSPGKGVQIENISFNNINMECIRPISVLTNAKGRKGGPPDHKIRNISFSHIRASAAESNIFIGYGPDYISDIDLHDVKITYFDYRKDPDYLAYMGDKINHNPNPEYGFFEWIRKAPRTMDELLPKGKITDEDMEHLKRLLSILMAKASPAESLHFEYIDGVRMNDVRIVCDYKDPEFTADAAFENCSNVKLLNCELPRGIKGEKNP